MNIPAGIFKAKCLRLMDEVQKYRKEITITKFGKPVAKLVPIKEKMPSSGFGCMKGTIKLKVPSCQILEPGLNLRNARGCRT